jgi:hypothetical protein
MTVHSRWTFGDLLRIGAEVNIHGALQAAHFAFGPHGRARMYPQPPTLLGNLFTEMLEHGSEFHLVISNRYEVVEVGVCFSFHV